MLAKLRRKEPLLPELSYASPGQPPVKRWFIRSVEEFSGRRRYARLYDVWRREIAPTGHDIFTRMLRLIEVGLDVDGPWPPADLPDTPIVIVANHPFGIGDGIAALSLAERLGRPFRVMIHKDLLKIPDMAPYSLPIDFSETKDALKNNLAVRQEALQLLKAGVTIVVFPAGGVATAPRGFGKARDLPWKMFPARLIQEAGAAVIPVHFSGQNGRLFHLVSGPMNFGPKDGKLAHLAAKVSLTMRTSLLIREFAKLSGKSIKARVGPVLTWDCLRPLRDRKELIAFLYGAVSGLAEEPARKRRRVRVSIKMRRRAAAPSTLAGHRDLPSR